MSQKPFPKWRQRFLKYDQSFLPKGQNFVHFLRYEFVQISPTCRSTIYQIMYGEILNFRCQRQ